MTTKVINLMAGPGTGKSTTAAGLFYLMKRAGESVELVTEWAKEKVWQNDIAILDDQLYVFAKQRQRQRRLLGQVDWIITDSPLIHSYVYGKNEREEVRQFFIDEFNQFYNVNIFLQRVKAYVPAGRLQTEAEAHELDKQMEDVLSWATGSSYHTVVADGGAPERIYGILQNGV